LEIDYDFFHVEIDDFYQDVETFYLVKKNIIVDEWKNRRRLVEREERKRKARIDFSGHRHEIRNTLFKSLKNINQGSKD